MLIGVQGVDTKEKASSLVGKTVKYTAPGKKKTTITGKVSSAHGSKGVVRAIFEKGMPGQSLGQKVEIA
jgi:large subunit ribosomal protein L35Ae